MEKYISTSAKQTQSLGKMLAQEIRAGAIICLQGDLGSGKTTFTQGFLKGLGVKGPYTSPTFVIIKKYQRPRKAKDVYHIDAYRVKEKGLLDLGWKEIVADNLPAGGNIVIIEWADRVKKIIPPHSIWIRFVWLNKNERKITVAKNPVLC